MSDMELRSGVISLGDSDAQQERLVNELIVGVDGAMTQRKTGTTGLLFSSGGRISRIGIDKPIRA